MKSKNELGWADFRLILLIAPLGLAAVIIDTILIAVTSFVNATAGDAVVNFLQPSQIKTLQAEIISQQST